MDRRLRGGRVRRGGTRQPRSFERSRGLLTEGDAVAFARLLAARAHRAGLAVAQKNTAALLPARRRIGFDFAVVEECGRYGECSAFAQAYDGRIFDVEDHRADFAAACTGFGEASVTLRDRGVRSAGSRGYVYDHC